MNEPMIEIPLSLFIWLISQSENVEMELGLSVEEVKKTKGAN
ncbi:hypothetical protein ERIN107935_10045 [Erysipelothrix inopinata]|nr:hypothetical protein [Erysipelothrix inopinata]